MSQTINVDEYVQAKQKLLAEMSDFENKGVMTKKEYILKLKDIERPLILAGYYPDVKLNDLCSFIGEQLEKYNVSYSRTKLPELFEDDEKRIYKSAKTNVTDGDKSNSPPLVENQQGIIGHLDFLEKQIGKSYDVMESSHAADKLQTLENIAAKSLSHIKTLDKNYKTLNYFVDLIERTFGSVETAEDLLNTLPKKQRDRLDALITKYHNDVLLITEFEESLIDIKENQIKEMQATQAMTSKDLDQRSKLTNWEKLMIVLAMKAGDIAKNQCAKLNGIDKKHITNNIHPKESPVEPFGENKHHRYLSWFKCIKINGRTFDISRWFEEQIIRGQLDLEFKPIVLADAKVSD